jgi:hypothetical protein
VKPETGQLIHKLPARIKGRPDRCRCRLLGSASNTTIEARATVGQEMSRNTPLVRFDNVVDKLESICRFRMEHPPKWAPRRG